MFTVDSSLNVRNYYPCKIAKKLSSQNLTLAIIFSDSYELCKIIAVVQRLQFYVITI